LKHSLALPLAEHIKAPKRTPLELTFPRYALRFPGASDNKIELSYLGDFTTELTVIIILRKYGFTGEAEAILYNGVPTDNNVNFILYIDTDNYLRLSSRSAGAWDSAISSKKVFADGRFHVYVIRYLNGTVEFIFDFKSAGSDTTHSSLPSSDTKKSRIALSTADMVPLLGDIAFLTVYSKYLSIYDIRKIVLNIYNIPKDGLVLHYVDFILPDASKIFDLSPNANDGLVYSASRINVRKWEIREVL